jgi:hypothetical protein
MEKGLSPKARELLEKIRAAGEKGITSPEMAKMGDLAYAPEDELSDKDLIEWNWERREEGGKTIHVKVCRVRER